MDLCNLAGNSIEAVPDSIGRLMGLRVLFLQGNRLATLPASLKECRKLERVNVLDNPMDASDDLRETLAVLRAKAADRGGFIKVPRDLA